jgi:hypothetical protein
VAGRVPPPEISSDLQAAQETLETLLKELPDLPKARARLARLMMFRGRLALDRGDPVEAGSHFTKASEEWERALNAQPSNPTYRVERDRCLDSLRALGAPGSR